ncbi:MAG: type II toxin-antitoxin system RelE/ParE family toxin [Hyphomicrobiaceae bacterium]
MTLRVRPEAQADILEAARWYEDREPGVGVALVSEAEAIFRRIERGPRSFRIAYRGLRIALGHRFPYAAYFLSEGDDVIVFAVLHQRRDRKVLDERLEGQSH